jgi:hypothetical protein
MQYPFLGIQEMLWGQKIIVEHYEGYCIIKPKPKWIAILGEGYFV